jgi:hypothetical protein
MLTVRIGQFGPGRSAGGSYAILDGRRGFDFLLIPDSPE